MSGGGRSPFCLFCCSVLMPSPLLSQPGKGSHWGCAALGISSRLGKLVWFALHVGNLLIPALMCLSPPRAGCGHSWLHGTPLSSGCCHGWLPEQLSPSPSIHHSERFGAITPSARQGCSDRCCWGIKVTPSPCHPSHSSHKHPLDVVSRCCQCEVTQGDSIGGSAEKQLGF